MIIVAFDAGAGAPSLKVVAGFIFVVGALAWPLWHMRSQRNYPNLYAGYHEGFPVFDEEEWYRIWWSGDLRTLLRSAGRVSEAIFRTQSERSIERARRRLVAVLVVNFMWLLAGFVTLAVL